MSKLVRFPKTFGRLNEVEVELVIDSVVANEQAVRTVDTVRVNYRDKEIILRHRFPVEPPALLLPGHHLDLLLTQI